MSAFHIDGRIHVKMEFDLAMRLGELILNARPNDAQLRAFGHELVNYDEELAKKYRFDRRDENFVPKEIAREVTSEWKRPISSNPVSITVGMHEKVATKKVRWGVEPAR